MAKKAEIKIPKDQLDSMLREVSMELTEMLKSEQALAKSSIDDAPAEESEGSEGPASPPPAEDEMSAPAEESAPAEASAPAAEGAPEGVEASPEQEQAIEPAPTVEALTAEYAKLDPEAQKMHYLAAKQALMATMGQDQGMAPEAAPPAAAPPAPEASAPAAAAPPEMGKAELKKDMGIKGDTGPKLQPSSPLPKLNIAPVSTGPKPAEHAAAMPSATPSAAMAGGAAPPKAPIAMGKSEKRIQELEQQLQFQTEEVAKLARVIETPIRKSVKGISDMRFVGGPRANDEKAPVANLTKAEVTAALREKARDAKLSKNDRELISQYCSGGVNISKIEHLLVDAAK